MTQTLSAYEAMPQNKYYTPAWVTEALLSVESFSGAVLEPAAGAGHMLDVMTAAGISVIGQDIAPDRADIGEQDFLLQLDSLPNIVTNPPFGVQGRLALRFIRHALNLTKGYDGKVAMLLPVDFDSGSSRQDVFKDHPAFAAQYALTRRIAWANLERKVNAAGRLVDPTTNHALFVWDWMKPGWVKPTKGYLP